QFPWLLTGVVIVEALFNYKGFGWTLVRAADNNDIDLLLACSMVAVVVVLVTQLISDIGYMVLNPRVRVGRARSRSRAAFCSSSRRSGSASPRSLRSPSRSGGGSGSTAGCWAAP